MTNKELLINYLTKKPNKNETWYDLAVKFNIGEGLTKIQRSKKANDVWRGFVKRGIKIINNPVNPKKLFYDIEVSPNIGFFWQPGHKISIDYNSIIQERAVICISYKWQGNNKVNTLKWNKGDDKKLLEDFIKVFNQADVVIGHNVKNFDTKWLLGRAVKHGIEVDTNFKQEDTLTIARSIFRFNSNRLDYIGQYLGLGKKINTSYDLWKDIVLKNDKKAMESMTKYCEQDVILLEKIYDKLIQYTKKKGK
jgi:hypothetical protein